MSDNNSYGLTEDEMIFMFQNCNMNNLLLPLQKHPTKYKPYIKFPGRVEKKNPYAIKNVPKIAYELYSNFDKDYVTFFNEEVDSIKKNTVVDLSELIGKIVDLSVFTRVSTNEYEQLFIDILAKDKSFDINYFLIKLKILGYALPEIDALKVKHQWDILEIKYLAQKENKELYEKLLNDTMLSEKKKQEELSASFNKDKDDLIKRISKIEREKELQHNQFKDDLEQKEKEYLKKVEVKEALQRVNEDEIYNLNLRIRELTQINEGLAENYKNAIEQKEIFEKDLQDKKNQIYDDIELEWMERNEENQRELRAIQFEISNATEEKNTLIKNLEKLQDKIDFYNKELNNYLENIDVKLIEQRVQKLMVGWQKDTITNGSNLVSGSVPYIKAEVTRLDNPICDDYTEFCEIAESNLRMVGVRKDAKRVLFEFVSAFIADLSPVICGYRSLEIAQAIISAWYSEAPMIIEIPAGFHDSSLLGKIIMESKSQCIILGNIIGGMNESVLLPILRDRNSFNKKIVLLCEDTMDLEYLSKSYFNYLYFIQGEVTEACVTEQISYRFSNDIIFSAHKLNYGANEKGYMIARALFKNTRVSSSYVLTRGRLCCVLLENNFKTKDIVDILLKEIEIFCDTKDEMIIKQNLQEYKILEYVEE